MFRTGGNINFEDHTDVVSGDGLTLNIDQKKDSLSFIQYARPLTHESPYFFVQIQDLSWSTLKASLHRIQI